MHFIKFTKNKLCYFMTSLLYENLHPNKSLKGTGYKDEKKAMETIELIKFRSPKYQFDVVNTMYNRAKYHPNQTEGMRNAMNIFEKWLERYGKMDKKEYPFLDINIIKKYANNNDFINHLKKVNGKFYKLQYIPYGKYDYLSYRTKIIEDIMKKKIKYFRSDGKPTKEHLCMISYGYSPYPEKL